jgi:hypothetical protein
MQAPRTRAGALFLLGATMDQQNDVDAFSIREFCDRNGISWGHYFNLRKRGQAPREMRAGRRVLITVEAAAEWRAAQSVAA